MAKQDTYTIIASQILGALEAGTRPWERCFEVTKGGMPVSVRNVEYTGTNRMLLMFQQYKNSFSSNVWLTFNEIKKVGGDVKGQKSSVGVFWKSYKRKNIDTGKEDDFMFAKRFSLFNTDQIKDLPDDYMDKFKGETLPEYDNDPIERAEEFIANIPHTMETKDCVPCFIPSADLIRMPELKHFKTTEQYYATYLHELIHFVGGKSRLNRKFKLGDDKLNYYQEELVAEIGSAFLLPSIGIQPLINEEHAPYISGYIKLLKSHPKAFISACSKAEEACKYLKEFQNKEVINRKVA